MFKSKSVANKKNGFNPGKKILEEAVSEVLFQIRLGVMAPLRALCVVQKDDRKKQILAMVIESCERLTQEMTRLSPPACSEQDEPSDHQVSSLSQGSFRGM
jgi:hypothetical protein